MNKIPVLFILTCWYGGGIEKVFSSIATVLFESGINNKILLYVVNGFDAHIYELPPGVTLLRSFNEIRSVKKIFGGILPINFSGDWKSAVYSRCISKDYISWIHCNPDTMYTAKTARINFLLLKKSKAVVTVCKEQKKLLETKYGFNNDIFVMYPFINKKEIREKSSKQLDDINFNYFLMPARIDCRSKDFYTLIRAYSFLPNKITEKYKLVFLGDGKDKRAVEQFVYEIGLAGSILFPGFDPNPYRWMKRAACVILCSKTEGFGISVLEAMVCDVPLIITKYHTGSTEVSENGKNCLLIDIGDIFGLANAMFDSIAHPEVYTKMISSASIFVDIFQFSNYEKKIRDFFRNYTE